MTPKVWASGDKYIVQTNETEGLAYGRLVNLKTKQVGPEVPIDSIARFMPYDDFQPFTGDATGLFEILKGAS